MGKNYWQDYWDSYFDFMAVYLRELQDKNSNADMKSEYIEVSKLFEPDMPLEQLQGQRPPQGPGQWMPPGPPQ